MGCELSILNVWLVSGASRRSRWFRPKRTASAASVVTLKASSLFTAPHVQDVLVCLLFRSSILMDRDAKKTKNATSTLLSRGKRSAFPAYSPQTQQSLTTATKHSKLLLNSILISPNRPRTITLRAYLHTFTDAPDIQNFVALKHD